MKVLQVFMDSVQRILGAIVGLIALVIVAGGFVTHSEFRSAQSESAARLADRKVALIQPLREPTMARAYTILKRNGRIRNGSKGTVHMGLNGKVVLTNTDKEALNSLYTHLSKQNSSRTQFAPQYHGDEIMFESESGGWGSAH